MGEADAPDSVDADAADTADAPVGDRGAPDGDGTAVAAQDDGASDTAADDSRELTADEQIPAIPLESASPSGSAPDATFIMPPTPPPDADKFGPITLSERSTVSTVGLDEVNFGMTVQQAQTAAGVLLVPVAPISNCYRVVPYEGPEGIVFLVYDGTIERVDIIGGPITTRSGVGIGTSEETVVSIFGDSIKRSERSDGTVDLVFEPRDVGDRDFRVIFNVADGEVRAYKSGRVPQILAETGCEVS